MVGQQFDQHGVRNLAVDNDHAFHALFDAAPDSGAWPLRREHHPTARSEEPFDAWRARLDRTAY